MPASKPAFAPLPRGARDLLPARCQRWRGLTRDLLERFESWGYRQVRPPAIEYFEVISKGLDSALRERSLRFIEAGSGREVAMRADLTPQIARMVAQRVGGSLQAGDQVRLCYAADTLAAPADGMDRAERHQVGVELLGEVAPHGDAELIALCDEALRALGSQGHRFDLGETQVARRALSLLCEPAREAARFALARKDTSALVAALDMHDAEAGDEGAQALSAPQRSAIAGLGGLYGEPRETLARAQDEIAALGVQDELARLSSVLDALQRIAPDTLARVELDLGEARGHEYYTGLRLRVWAPGSAEPVARGGRYDDLLARFGGAMPASGFAVDLDALERALDSAGVARGDQARGAVMVGLSRKDESDATRAAAFTHAASLRGQGQRAWVELSDSQARAQTRAEAGGAQTLHWFGKHDSCAVERSDTPEANWAPCPMPQALPEGLAALGAVDLGPHAPQQSSTQALASNASPNSGTKAQSK